MLLVVKQERVFILDNHVGYALTDKIGLDNLKEGLSFNLKKIKFYPYYLENQENFFNLDFTPFQASYVNELLVNSIFNAQLIIINFLY